MGQHQLCLFPTWSSAWTSSQTKHPGSAISEETGGVTSFKTHQMQIVLDLFLESEILQHSTWVFNTTSTGKKWQANMSYLLKKEYEEFPFQSMYLNKHPRTLVSVSHLPVHCFDLILQQPPENKNGGPAANLSCISTVTRPYPSECPLDPKLPPSRHHPLLASVSPGFGDWRTKNYGPDSARWQ